METQASAAVAPVLDHISFTVSDYAASRAFYDAVLAPLGIEFVMEMAPAEGARVAGYGRGGRPQFWFASGGISRGRVHVAFGAANRADVDAFHAAALATGARDHGAPGLRPEYHASYYAAFAYDPDGNNIEAVTHLPQ